MTKKPQPYRDRDEDLVGESEYRSYPAWREWKYELDGRTFIIRIEQTGYGGMTYSPAQVQVYELVRQPITAPDVPTNIHWYDEDDPRAERGMDRILDAVKRYHEATR